MSKKVAPVLFLLIFALGVLWGCAAPEPVGEPALPQGFKDARLPNTDLLAYGYVNQGEPTSISGELLSLPLAADVLSLSAWAGPSGREDGMGIRFVNPEDAELAYEFIPQETNRWEKLAGDEVFIIQVPEEGSSPLKDAISSGQWATLESRYPHIWQLMRRLPSQPPARPVAAGFVALSESLFETLAESTGNEDIKNVLPALSMARIDNVAFAAYANKPLKIPIEMTPQGLEDVGLGVLLVGRAGYPSFLLNLLFGSVVSRFGMEEVSFQGGKAYYIAQGDLHVAAMNRWGYIYIAAAPSKAQALELLASIFK